MFKNEELNVNDRWKLIKNETGQSTHTSPQVIVEGGKFFTNHLEIANSLNRQYVRKINNLIEKMETSDVDPLINYKQSIGPKGDQLSFTFTTITMAQLRKTISKMKATGSTGEDDISVRMIKQAQNELEPILLHLFNMIVRTTTFPESLKTSKVVPIRKTGKEPDSSDGWRPVNLVAAISKILERIFLRQILEHLDTNDLIGHSHHGAVRFKSTQSLVSELHDKLIEDLDKDDDSALVVLDQSKGVRRP